MNCIICKTGVTHQGKATCTVERSGSIIVFKNAEAEICDNCGEAYFSVETTEKLQSLAEDAIKKGNEFEVLKLS